MFYKIADLLVEVQDGIALPSFEPFELDAPQECEPELRVTLGEVSMEDAGAKLDHFNNDAGVVTLYESACGREYLMSVCFGGPENRMRCAKDFSYAIADIRDEANAGLVLCSMVRMAFSQRVILFDGISMHSSTVVRDGRGYMFLGRSGTGKSTHSRQWLSAFPGSWLLNDDNPVVRFAGDTLMVYGTPWSGKTRCYRNASVPVAGIVRLSQAKENLWKSVKGVQAWITLFPSCALISRDDFLYLHFESTLNRIVSTIRIGQLDCLPDEGSAVLCFKGLNE